MNNRYIAFEGNIGAGKTTLARLLAEKTGARLMLEEFADNPFLASFYENRSRYAFSLEMAFLADRFHQLGNYKENDLFQPLLIADYSIYKSLIFAQNNLSGNELHLYRNFFEIIAGSLRKPDLVIFLNRSMDTLERQILNRGREYELMIERQYLLNIQENYIRFFKQNAEVHVVVVDADRYDFIGNEAHLEWLKYLVSQTFKPGLNFID